MRTDNRSSGGSRFLLNTAAFVIIIAAMRASVQILVPFLVAAFVALICGPPVSWLRRKGVPTVLAMLIVVTGIVGIGVGMAALLGTSLNDFTRAMPSYQARLQQQITAWLTWSKSIGVELPSELLTDLIAPGKVMELIARLLASLGALVTNGLLILLTVVFILLEASSFPVKLRAALGDRMARFEGFDEITTNVNKYLAMKTLLSLATGVAVAIWVWLVGLDFPLLWGLTAFLLNYVPNIGSIIAAVPAVSLAIVQLGLGGALLIAAGYVVINFVLGNVVEPKVMGSGLGLSTLVVFISLVFWGWVFGAVGMLLSVPLTMTVKIALESREDTRWIAVLLGTEKAARTPLAQAPAAAGSRPAKTVPQPDDLPSPST